MWEGLHGANDDLLAGVYRVGQGRALAATLAGDGSHDALGALELEQGFPAPGFVPLLTRRARSIPVHPGLRISCDLASLPICHRQRIKRPARETVVRYFGQRSHSFM